MVHCVGDVEWMHTYFEHGLLWQILLAFWSRPCQYVDSVLSRGMYFLLCSSPETGLARSRRNFMIIFRLSWKPVNSLPVHAIFEYKRFVLTRRHFVRNLKFRILLKSISPSTDIKTFSPSFIMRLHHCSCILKISTKN